MIEEQANVSVDQDVLISEDRPFLAPSLFGVFESLYEGGSYFPKRTLFRAPFCDSDSLFSKNMKGFENLPAPLAPPPRSRRSSKRPHFLLNKADRPHGAKPIEGEDTYRGIFTRLL